MPEVSIILPCHNSEQTLARALQSVQAQTFGDFEILIIEDGSTDRTVAVAEEFAAADPRIRVFSSPERRGVSGARNVGLDKSRGKWIGLIDADDLWTEGRLETLLANANDTDFVADNIMTYDAVAGLETGALYPPHETRFIDVLNMLDASIGGVAYDFGLSKPIMKREFITTHGLRYIPSIVASEDLLFYLEALALGVRFRIVDIIGYVYSTPIGLKSAQRSPHTRTVANARAYARGLRDVQKRHAARLSSKEHVHFDDAIERQCAWADFTDGVRSRRVAPVVTAFAGSRFVREQVWRRASRAVKASLNK